MTVGHGLLLRSPQSDENIRGCDCDSAVPGGFNSKGYNQFQLEKHKLTNRLRHQRKKNPNERGEAMENGTSMSVHILQLLETPYKKELCNFSF